MMTPVKNTTRSGMLRSVWTTYRISAPIPIIDIVSTSGPTISRDRTVFIVCRISCRDSSLNRSTRAPSSPNALMTRMPENISTARLDWSMLAATRLPVALRAFLPK